MEKDIEFLKEVKILRDLNNDQINEFFTICEKVKFKTDDVIMAEGEEDSTMYIFVDGTVEITQTLTLKIGKKGFEDAEKSLFKIPAAGNFFGDMAMLANSPRTATISAVTDCQAYKIERDDFISLCQKDTDLGYKVIKRISEVLCSRLEQSNKNVLKLTSALSIALSR